MRCAVSVALYGAELYGFDAKLVAKLRKEINLGWKWILGVSDKSRANLTSVMEEFSVGSFAARAKGSRVRLYSKAANGGLKTWLSDLVQKPHKNKKSSWVSGTSRWLKRFGPILDEEAKAAVEDDDSGRTYAARVVAHSHAREQDSDISLSWSRYQKRSFVKTKGWTRWGWEKPELGVGLTALLQCRAGCFLTAKRNGTDGFDRCNRMGDRLSFLQRRTGNSGAFLFNLFFF